MTSWIKQIKGSKIALFENEILSKHTSWKIGGPADAYIIPADKEELIKTIQILNECNVKWKVIGNGSNILVSDKGYSGAVISIKRGFNQVSIDNNLINVGAGFSLIQLANFAAKNCLSGLEFAAGIPGTAGGAVAMNAGAFGSDISNILKSAEVLLENGDVTTWRKEDFKFEYRSSILHKRNLIILSALLNLKIGDYNRIILDMNKYKEIRMKLQPYGDISSGSVFKNPANDYAARLIEELGLKGYNIGGAKVSTKHANFIINTGNASSGDVISLINFIRQEVNKKYNIELISEVELIGE